MELSCGSLRSYSYGFLRVCVGAGDERMRDLEIGLGFDENCAREAD